MKKQTINLQNVSFNKLKTFVKELSKNNSKIIGEFSLVGQYEVADGGDGDMTVKQMVSEIYKDWPRVINAVDVQIPKIWKAIDSINKRLDSVENRLDNVIKKNNLKE